MHFASLSGSVVHLWTRSGPHILEDPILAQQPPWSYSLISQVMANAVVFTMLSVLMLQLAFTARFHCPITGINFVLQLTTVVISLSSVVLSLVIIFDDARGTSRIAPYMYNYVQVNVPPDDWNNGQMAAYSLQQSALLLALHATHIQFLTLLFPSSLEQKLILCMLVPVAVLASAFEFASDYISQPLTVSDLCDTIRTTFNSSLTLLYTMGLLIWSLLVNRKRAWQTDGGTTAFGALAIALALAGTCISFIEVRDLDNLQWLPTLIRCILTWQSWAGFWWWVGSGMYVGEIEGRERERRERRKESRQGKWRSRIAKLPPVDEGLLHKVGRQMGLASGVDPAARTRRGSNFARRRASAHTDVVEAIEMRPLGADVPVEHGSSTSSHWSDSNPTLRFLKRLPVLRRIVDTLVSAHVSAIRKRADDQVLHAVTASTTPWTEQSARRSASRDARSPPSRDVGHGEEPTLGDERGMGEEGPDEVGRRLEGLEAAPDTQGEGMDRTAWHWRGPIRRHRLKEVDTYD